MRTSPKDRAVLQDGRSSPIAAVILAAGASSRFGGDIPKQLFPFAGQPLVRRTAQTTLSSSLSPVIVVIGHEQEAVRNALSDLPVQIIANAEYRTGQSTSVRAGLTAVSAECAAAVFIPCDQPFLTAELLDGLGRLFSVATPDGRQAAGAVIVIPTWKTRRGAPVLFSRELFSELAALQGDEGGRQVIRAHEECVVLLELEKERPLFDIDTIEDYRKLLEMIGTRS